MKFIITVAFFFLSSIHSSYGEYDPMAPEREVLTQMAELAKSNDANDRVYALDQIIGLQSSMTPTVLIESLINDPIPKVKRKAFRALNVISSMNTFTQNEAKFFCELLEEEITKQNIDKGFSENLKGTKLELFAEKAGALNALYMWYPLVSAVEFENWQQENYSYLIRRLLSESDGRYPLEVAVLVSGLREPNAINQILPRLVDRLLELSPEECRFALLGLWSHPVFGSGKPMNIIFRMELITHKDKLSEKVTHNLDDEFELREIEKILNEIK